MLVGFMLYRELESNEKNPSLKKAETVSRYHEFLLSKRLSPNELKQDMRTHQYTLSVGGNNKAFLAFPADQPEAVRIVIEKAATRTPWDIQLNQPGHAVKEGQRYTVSFRARADQARESVVAFAENHPPWGALGLRKTISLTTEWQTFNEVFTAIADDDSARIHFDLGGDDRSVEFSDVDLHNAITER